MFSLIKVRFFKMLIIVKFNSREKEKVTKLATIYFSLSQFVNWVRLLLLKKKTREDYF